MKNIKLVFKICLLLLLFTSCQQEATTPFGLGYYNLKGKVKELRETGYGVKVKSGVVNKAEQTVSNYLTFTPDGNCQNLLVVNYLSTDDSNNMYQEEHIYNSRNQLQNIVSEKFDSYTPYFDNNNYLTKYTYKLKSNEEPITAEFKYVSGRLVGESRTSGSEENAYYTKTFQYDSEGTKTKMEQSYGSEKKVMSCDSLGNVIVEEIYDKDSEKLKNTVSYTYYNYDDQGNWTTMITYTNKKPTALHERDIEYYKEAEIVQATTVKGDFSSIDGYIINLKFRLFHDGQLGETPSKILMSVLLGVSVLLFVAVIYLKRNLFTNFGGIKTQNGMKRMWMYNKEPYLKVATVLLIALCVFVVTLICIFLVGGTVWLIFAIISLLLHILVWVGIIATILGLITLVVIHSPWGLVMLIPGGLIWFNDDKIEEAGNRLVTTGFEFMQDLNMFGWGIDLFSGYWDVMVLVFVAPLILFTGIALLIIMLNSLLIGIEFIITKLYNVNRPCSACGSTVEPYYLIDGKKHPVALSPGMYGVFSHTSPTTGNSLPTLLIGGRWKLERECRGCNTKLNSKIADGSKKVGFGTDIHIGIVGHRSSGKSYLLYSGLQLLMNKYPKKISQIEAVNETKIEDKYRRIASREGIQTSDSNQYRAVQLIYQDSFRPIPYHLYFYDVAGEKFNSKSTSHQTAMEFYQNVQSILFVIDPKMIDYTGIPTSDELKNWLKTQGVNNQAEKYNIGSTFSMLKEILDEANRRSKKIDFSFVCVKKDLKYFEASGYNSNTISSADIEAYLCNDLGLNNVVYSAKAEFKSVRFYSVSTFTKDNEDLDNMFTDILKQRGVKIG